MKVARTTPCAIVAPQYADVVPPPPQQKGAPRNVSIYGVQYYGVLRGNSLKKLACLRHGKIPPPHIAMALFILFAETAV